MSSHNQNFKLKFQDQKGQTGKYCIEIDRLSDVKHLKEFWVLFILLFLLKKCIPHFCLVLFPFDILIIYSSHGISFLHESH